MLTTEQLTDVMALPLVNSTNASEHDCEITQDFTKEVILNKELENEQKKKSLHKIRWPSCGKKLEGVQQKLRLNEDQVEKLKKELEEKNSCWTFNQYGETQV